MPNCDKSSDSSDTCSLSLSEIINGITEKSCNNSKKKQYYYNSSSNSDCSSSCNTECETTKTECETTKTECEETKIECETTKTECETTKSECETTKSECKKTKSECEKTNTECETTKTECETTNTECETTNTECETMNTGCEKNKSCNGCKKTVKHCNCESTKTVCKTLSKNYKIYKDCIMSNNEALCVLEFILNKLKDSLPVVVSRNMHQYTVKENINFIENFFDGVLCVASSNNICKKIKVKTCKVKNNSDRLEDRVYEMDISFKYCVAPKNFNYVFVWSKLTNNNDLSFNAIMMLVIKQIEFNIVQLKAQSTGVFFLQNK